MEDFIDFVNPADEIRKAKEEVERLEKLLGDAKHRVYRLKKQRAIQKSGRPLYDYKKFKTSKLNKEKAHETKMVWWDTGTFNENSLSNMHLWVCKYCKVPVRKKYIATGHDHTDYDYNVCDCEGAAEHGKPYKDLR